MCLAQQSSAHATGGLSDYEAGVQQEEVMKRERT